MTIKGKELGLLSVDCGDVVCFSIDDIIHMMEDFGVDNGDVHSFVKDYGGINCEFHADGGYGVVKTTVVDKNYETYDAVIIGCPHPDDTLSILRGDQYDFEEFAESHYLIKEHGEHKCATNKNLWKQICDDYKTYLEIDFIKE